MQQYPNNPQQPNTNQPYPNRQPGYNPNMQNNRQPGYNPNMQNNRRQGYNPNMQYNRQPQRPKKSGSATGIIVGVSIFSMLLVVFLVTAFAFPGFLVKKTNPIMTKTKMKILQTLPIQLLTRIREPNKQIQQPHR